MITYFLLCKICGFSRPLALLLLDTGPEGDMTAR